MKYARVDDDGKVTDIIELPFAPVFHKEGGEEGEIDALESNRWREFADDVGVDRGWIYASGVFSPPPVQPPSKEVLAAYVMRRRDSRLDAGFEFNSVTYQSRATDRENILGASLLASMAISAGAQPGDYRWAGEASDFEWIALDNSMIKMDAQTVIALGAAQAARKRELIFLARLIKDEIAEGTITTMAEIDAAFG